jgi:two-component system, NtrC family, sensor kinase
MLISFAICRSSYTPAVSEEGLTTMDRPECSATADDLITLNRAVMVARLLSGMAHEVNNALQVIGGTVELLEEHPDITEDVVKGLAHIQTQGTRAAMVIAEVLAFAREKTDTIGRSNLRDIAAQAVALRSFAIRRAGLRIIFSAPDTDTFIVEGNGALIQQLILNLIANAEQAMAGQQGGTIQVDLRAETSFATLRVTDTGPGVARELANWCFEPFTTTRSRLESSGIGLAAARAIATRHGGTLEIESTESGATFVARLPLRGQKRDAEGPLQKA